MRKSEQPCGSKTTDVDGKTTNSSSSVSDTRGHRPDDQSSDWQSHYNYGDNETVGSAVNETESYKARVKRLADLPGAGTRRLRSAPAVRATTRQAGAEAGKACGKGGRFPLERDPVPPSTPYTADNDNIYDYFQKRRQTSATLAKEFRCRPSSVSLFKRCYRKKVAGKSPKTNQPPKEQNDSDNRKDGTRAGQEVTKGGREPPACETISTSTTTSDTDSEVSEKDEKDSGVTSKAATVRSSKPSMRFALKRPEPVATSRRFSAEGSMRTGETRVILSAGNRRAQAMGGTEPPAARPRRFVPRQQEEGFHQHVGEPKSWLGSDDSTSDVIEQTREANTSDGQDGGVNIGIPFTRRATRKPEQGSHKVARRMPKSEKESQDARRRLNSGPPLSVNSPGDDSLGRLKTAPNSYKVMRGRNIRQKSTPGKPSVCSVELEPSTRNPRYRTNSHLGRGTAKRQQPALGLPHQPVHQSPTLSQPNASENVGRSSVSSRSKPPGTEVKLDSDRDANQSARTTKQTCRGTSLQADTNVRKVNAGSARKESSGSTRKGSSGSARKGSSNDAREGSPDGAKEAGSVCERLFVNANDDAVDPAVNRSVREQVKSGVSKAYSTGPKKQLDTGGHLGKSTSRVAEMLQKKKSLCEIYRTMNIRSIKGLQWERNSNAGDYQQSETSRQAEADTPEKGGIRLDKSHRKESGGSQKINERRHTVFNVTEDSQIQRDKLHPNEGRMTKKSDKRRHTLFKETEDSKLDWEDWDKIHPNEGRRTKPSDKRRHTIYKATEDSPRRPRITSKGASAHKQQRSKSLKASALGTSTIRWKQTGETSPIICDLLSGASTTSTDGSWRKRSLSSVESRVAESLARKIYSSEGESEEVSSHQTLKMIESEIERRAQAKKAYPELETSEAEDQKGKRRRPTGSRPPQILLPTEGSQSSSVEDSLEHHAAQGKKKGRRRSKWKRRSSARRPSRRRTVGSKSSTGKEIRLPVPRASQDRDKPSGQEPGEDSSGDSEASEGVDEAALSWEGSESDFSWSQLDSRRSSSFDDSSPPTRTASTTVDPESVYRGSPGSRHPLFKELLSSLSPRQTALQAPSSVHCVWKAGSSSGRLDQDGEDGEDGEDLSSSLHVFRVGDSYATIGPLVEKSSSLLGKKLSHHKGAESSLSSHGIVLSIRSLFQLFEEDGREEEEGECKEEKARRDQEKEKWRQMHKEIKSMVQRRRFAIPRGSIGLTASQLKILTRGDRRQSSPMESSTEGKSSGSMQRMARPEMGHAFLYRTSVSDASKGQTDYMAKRWRRYGTSQWTERRRPEREEPGDDSEKHAQNYQIFSLVQSLVKARTHSDSRRRWVRAIELVLDVCYVARSMAVRSYLMTVRLPTFMDIGDSAIVVYKRSKSGQRLPEAYTVSDKEFCLNVEEKNTLRSAPEQRTERQLSMVLYSLQNIDAFCDFPLHTQKQMARLGLYALVHRNRVILRQGQTACNVYFILSGQVVVTHVVEGRSGPFRQTYAILGRGMIFGDLSIIAKTNRNATIATRKDTQLLVISKEDYISIFMPERLVDGIPEFIKYLSRCSWMKGWPVYKMLNSPKCFMRFYRHRHVIVTDSTDSPYFYVIRDGTCHVLMMLPCLKEARWADLERLLLKDLDGTTEKEDQRQADRKERERRKTLQGWRLASATRSRHLYPRPSQLELTLSSIAGSSSAFSPGVRRKRGGQVIPQQPLDHESILKGVMRSVGPVGIDESALDFTTTGPPDSDRKGREQLLLRKTVERLFKSFDRRQPSEDVLYWADVDTRRNQSAAQPQFSPRRMTTRGDVIGRKGSRKYSQKGRDSVASRTTVRGRGTSDGDLSSASSNSSSSCGFDADISNSNNNNTEDNSRSNKDKDNKKTKRDSYNTSNNNNNNIPKNNGNKRTQRKGSTSNNNYVDSDKELVIKAPALTRRLLQAEQELRAVTDDSRVSEETQEVALSTGDFYPSLSSDLHHLIPPGLAWSSTASGDDVADGEPPTEVSISVPALPKAPPLFRKRGRPEKEAPRVSVWERRRQYQVPAACQPRRVRSAPARRPDPGHTAFVVLQALREGDVFGWDQMDMPLTVKPKSHKVCLVSLGAEVIAVDKRFFVANANAEVQQKVHLMTHGYPSPEEVQHLCCLQDAWSKYRERELELTQQRLATRHRHGGLYFQRGPLVHPLASVGIVPDTR